MARKLKLIYRRLYAFFGPQYWWPAESAFEVIIGAILTQNTNWLNVEKAIDNLKKQRLLSAQKLYRLKHAKLARAIKPAGYYNIKARRLKEFLRFFFVNYKGNMRRLTAGNWQRLRDELLAVKGIGPETADSILLYALNKPVFVIDAYTRRILTRHGLLKDESDYAAAQNLFMQNLRPNVKLFNEYHALLVKLAKDFCRKNQPRCLGCPLKTKAKGGFYA